MSHMIGHMSMLVQQTPSYTSLQYEMFSDQCPWVRSVVWLGWWAAINMHCCHSFYVTIGGAKVKDPRALIFGL